MPSASSSDSVRGPAQARPQRRQGHDRGSVLVLTLVLTVVLAVVVMALARYVATSLSTSQVTSDRVRAVADLEIVAHDVAWQLANDPSCPLTVTPGAAPNGSDIAISGCTEIATTDGLRSYHVVLSAGSQRLGVGIDVVPSELLEPGHDDIAIVTELVPG